MNTKAEIDAANALPHGDTILEINCRVCHRPFTCFNRTEASWEQICTRCVIFGSDKAYHEGQLEAVKEYPDRYEPGAQEKLERYLRGEISKYELRNG